MIVKSHPSHPETSRLAAEAILGAAAECGMPKGTFAIVWGGIEAGRALVEDPSLYAVAFTGSERAGRALFDLAARRDRPIPVYAEMGSVNPLFVMPRALAVRGEAMARGYADSLVLGIGQFCTNPGVVVGIEAPAFDAFLAAVGAHLSAVAPGEMLDAAIRDAYLAGVRERRTHPDVTVHWVAEGVSTALFSVSAAGFLKHLELRTELFGPSAIAVRCATLDEMLAVADALEGQLTATVHFESDDEAEVKALLPSLVRMAGRLVANGFPTGVEVNAAMHHGGPYPATTDSRSTSVGTAAILRFVRPVAFQDFPPALLPPELREL